jgi:hypothetical protein
MAALDFGMALARGMLPTAQKAQKDLLDLAGGRNIFKSEDWWNKAVDKQISEGYRPEKIQTEYLVDTGLAQSGVTPRASGITAYVPDKPGILDSRQIPKGAIQTNPNRFQGGITLEPAKYITREVSLGFENNRKYFDVDELKDIASSAKAGAQRIKRESAATKASKKRLSRATGGLISKARVEGEAPATGLPALGEGGLGIVGSILGGGIKL